MTSSVEWQLIDVGPRHSLWPTIMNVLRDPQMDSDGKESKTAIFHVADQQKSQAYGEPFSRAFKIIVDFHDDCSSFSIFKKVTNV